MTIYESIMKMKLNARKDKDTTKVQYLTFLQGEIERNDDRSDGKVLKIIKSIYQELNLQAQIEYKTKAHWDELNFYQELIEMFEPKQLTRDEILSIMQNSLSGSSMGEVHKYFKANHEGAYDGKVLNEVYKEFVANG